MLLTDVFNNQVIVANYNSKRMFFDLDILYSDTAVSIEFNVDYSMNWHILDYIIKPYDAGYHTPYRLRPIELMGWYYSSVIENSRGLMI